MSHAEDLRGLGEPKFDVNDCTARVLQRLREQTWPEIDTEADQTAGEYAPDESAARMVDLDAAIRQLERLARQVLIHEIYIEPEREEDEESWVNVARVLFNRSALATYLYERAKAGRLPCCESTF